ncbi:glycosyltransferase family 2 protein [Alteromonas gilva]|uniref:Glycosyltransferase family 2 protein n=1 Tax=Alteromonas gilva TaxID=2987522 RepID=A0ABT5L7G8_9ALTE|nr:glycosyltransferase family 2 protein [Alteromonas gilva]MDC8832995.1 glycosyltransferase family 2 protein [Alteromonas gilva]
MIAIKAGVGVVPKPVRNFAKKNPALTSFYSRSLQKSGLFYGLPSKKKLKALYANTLRRQASKLHTIVAQQPIVQSHFNVVIFGANANQIKQTCLSLLPQSDWLNSVTVIGAEDNQLSALLPCSIHCAGHVNEASLTADLPALLINAGDELHPMALAVLARSDNYDMLYVDTDEKAAGAHFDTPRCLPDWNPDYHFSAGYVETGLVVAAHQITALKELSCATIGAIVAELWLADTHLRIKHLPFSLLHFTGSRSGKSAQLQELANCVVSAGGQASTLSKVAVNRVQWPLNSEPLVSLIIPTKNGKALVKACIESIINKTTYTNYEILLIDNNSDEADSLAYFEELATHKQITVLRYPHPFNYSAINNFAVQHARGELIGLINNDIEVITADWLEYMAGHAMRDDIGCVGAKLLYSDDRVQHAGVVMGYGGGAGHAHKYFPRFHPGYMNRLAATQNFSAVTAACLLVKKSHYLAVGGLNDTNLTVAFNDVDFCLRVRELGLRNLYCAEVEHYHHESVSRGLDVSKEKMARFNAELDYLKQHWAHVIENDPAYNPNLTLRRENFAVKDEKEWRETSA